jgi:hypothetical protein
MNRLFPILLSLCLALFGTSCATPSIVTKPKVINTVRWKNVEVDAELLQDRQCPSWEEAVLTGDIVNAYQACWTANAAHNVDKGKLRGLQPQ